MNKALTPIEASRLEDSVRRHRGQILADLEHGQRDQLDLHLRVAGHLRVLLLDVEVPVLLRYAEHKGVCLRVWGPDFNPEPGWVEMFDSAQIISAAPVCSFPGMPPWREMPISEYLDSNIGSVVIGPPGKQSSLPYSPRKLIKWVANKDGNAHLQLMPYPSLEAVKGSMEVFGTVSMPGLGEFGAVSDFKVRSEILQIGQWAAHACQLVLEAGPGPTPVTND